MKNFLLNLSRRNKIIILMFIDACVGFFVWFAFGLPLSTYLSSSGKESLLELTLINIDSFIIPAAIAILIFLISGFYKSLVRFKSSGENFWKASVGAGLFGISYILIFISKTDTIQSNFLFIFMIQGILLSSMFLSGITFSREFAKYILGDRHVFHDAAPVIIYGAGSIGSELAQSLYFDKSKKVIAFYDDEADLHGATKQGIPIISNYRALEKLRKKHDNLEIFLAMPSLDSFSRRNIIQKLEQLEVSVKSVPAYHELISDSESLSRMQRLSLEDILPSGRVENSGFEYLDNKTVLVTGAGGSIGSELVRQILKNNPKKVILLDISEFNLHQISEESRLVIKDRKASTEISIVIGDVRSKNSILRVFKNNKVDFIFHAAAYKHVPILEEQLNFSAAIENNILGTLNMCEFAISNQVERFVLISTDKAVRPTNIMGATKRMAEIICQAFNALDKGSIFSMVRFGNVIDSSGSVIPLFREQISRGGPLTITHQSITRFFMTIPEAASLVLSSAMMAKGGEVFLLDMGEQIKVIELAERMIRLSGRNVSQSPGDGGIEIIDIGLRPGEKLYEELLISGAEEKTSHKKIFKSSEDFYSYNEMISIVDSLKSALAEDDSEKIKSCLKEYVDGYNPTNEKS